MSKLFPNHIIDFEKGTVYSIKKEKYICAKTDEDGYHKTHLYDCYGNRYSDLSQVIFAEGANYPKHLWPIDEKGKIYEVDHVLPVMNGGSDIFSNLRLVSHKDNMNNETSRKNNSKAKKENPNKSMLGKHHTEESKRKISEAIKGRIESEETRMKKSEALKGRKLPKEQVEKKSKQVCQLTLDGKLIAIWPSISEAGRNGFNQSSVCFCCKGKLKSTGGFQWLYKEDYDNMEKGS